MGAPHHQRRRLGRAREETVTFYHGGIAGKHPGDDLVPASPHVEDGCPICRSRAAGRTLSVGEYRRWLVQHGDAALPILRALADADDDEPMDPPSKEQAVYLTTDRDYARWYAARSGNGDLYRVTPVGLMTKSAEDPFLSYTVDRARVLEVLERGVHLLRADRRAILKRWKKADRARRRSREEATP
jgi:hypothetical protein